MSFSVVKIGSALDPSSHLPFPKLLFFFLICYFIGVAWHFSLPSFSSSLRWPRFHLYCPRLLPQPKQGFQRGWVVHSCGAQFLEQKIKQVQTSLSLAWGDFQLLFKPARLLFESFTGVRNKVPKSGFFSSNNSLGTCPMCSCCLGGQKKHPSEWNKSWTKLEQQCSPNPSCESQPCASRAGSRYPGCVPGAAARVNTLNYQLALLALF